MKKSLHILTIYLLLVGMVALAQVTPTPPPSSRQVQKMDNAKIGGATALEASAALEIESTTTGVLISRMTTLQRDAITSPSNSLLIFNSTNNTFEVYKSTCTCWVALMDGGGNSPIENTAPSVYNLNYTGNFYAGQSVTINYIYVDNQGDVESGTTIQWQQATDANGTAATIIAGANAATYTIPSTVGTTVWIRALITPRTTTGLKNGILATTGYVKVDPSSSPGALNVTLTGTAIQGSELTGNYTFTGGNGTETSNPLLPTEFSWQTASSSDGINTNNAGFYNASSFGRTYIPQSDLIGKYIRFGVRTRDGIGTQASNFVYSTWLGPITIASEQAPVASNVAFTPTLSAVNFNLNSSYIYRDANGDPEGASTYQWYRADDANGLNEIAIAGANSSTYTTVPADASKFLAVEVTPVALTGTSPGTSVKNYNTTNVYPAATFTFTSTNIEQLPLFSAGRTMNAENNIRVEVDVTIAGGVSFTSNTVNGYSFSNSLILTSTGVQWVTLNAVGGLNSYTSAGDNFTITGAGNGTQTKSINIKNTLTGAGATLSNGTAAFSTNTTCTNSLISAGYNSTSCTGNVTVGSNTYGMVLINGQCWMTRNIVELPTAPCAASINTGCNVWLNTTPGDIGTWGYYNSTTTNGSAGFATTAPITDAGLLYQWSAAMNGSTAERAKGVCPTGWHIPSDCEWMYLEHGLGMSISDQQNSNTRSSGNVGNALRSAGTGATNTSGFNALLTGTKSFSGGAFAGLNSNSEFWTSTGGTSANANRRQVQSAIAGVGRGSFSKGLGLSVRCLRD